MLHQKFFNDETIDAPVDIRIIAGINDIILHTRPAVAIPRPACFFETESLGANDKVLIQGVAFAEISAVKGS